MFAEKGDEYAIIEIEGFPFFGKQFEYTEDREVQSMDKRVAGINVTTQQRTCNGSFLVAGELSTQQIQHITSEEAVPQATTIEVSGIGDYKYKFGNAIVTCQPSSFDDMMVTNVEFTATDMETAAI